MTKLLRLRLTAESYLLIILYWGGEFYHYFWPAEVRLACLVDVQIPTIVRLNSELSGLVENYSFLPNKRRLVKCILAI